MVAVKVAVMMCMLEAEGRHEVLRLAQLGWKHGPREGADSDALSAGKCWHCSADRLPVPPGSSDDKASIFSLTASLLPVQPTLLMERSQCQKISAIALSSMNFG